MSYKEAREILTHFNAWRRCEIGYLNYTPKQIGIAIEKAIEALDDVTLQCCYNYIQKQQDSDEKRALIEYLSTRLVAR